MVDNTRQRRINYIDTLIQSHDAARVLEYFAFNDGPIYLRDLARRKRINHGNLSRILRTFEKRGLLTSKTDNNKRYFCRNSDKKAWEAIRTLAEAQP